LTLLPLHIIKLLIVHQRWAESKKLTPNPALKTKTTDPAPNPVSLQILDFGSGLCPTAHLLCYVFIQYIPVSGGY